MTRATLAVGTLALAVLLASACGDFGDLSWGEGGRGEPDAGGPSSAQPPDGTQGAEAFATGVVLVHAARFPSFRLCFDTHRGALPYPDSTMMPEANVVGVEIGSFVRFDELERPSKVYVIPESDVRNGTVPCGTLIDETGATDEALTPNIEYQTATLVDPGVEGTLGRDAIHILAITGCGGTRFLDVIPPPQAQPEAYWREICGPDWDPVNGNLEARVLTLRNEPSALEGDEETTHVRLMHLAPAIALLEDASVEVAFGELDGPDGDEPDGGELDDLDGGTEAGTDAGTLHRLPLGELFTSSEEAILRFDRANEAVYATHGFRIDVRSGDITLSTKQSLANVQELSAPTTLPTTYYEANSRYVLFLVGDPQHGPMLPADAGANPQYNPRLALHFLAMPLVDPSLEEDGGAGEEDAGAPPSDEDAGSAS